MLEPDHADGQADAPQHTVLGEPRRKASMRFIFFTALMDITSMGIMIPVLPLLVKHMVGGNVATAAIWTGIFASCWGAMQFFCSPIQGMLSDRFGRRPVLLISIFGLAVDFLFMAWAPTLAWLFLGRLINGATAASFSTAAAYVTDISAPQDRARRFGIMGGAFGAGFILGPAIGGLLGDPNIGTEIGKLLHDPNFHLPFLDSLPLEQRLRVPFIVAACLAAINWLYGFFVLPESLPKDRREPRFNWKKANPLGSLRLLSRHRDLLGMAGVNFLFQLAHNVLPAIFVLYVNHRYGWTQAGAAMLLICVGLANIPVQGVLTGVAAKRFGERGVVLIGLVSGFAGLTIYGLAPSGYVFLAGVPVMAFFGFVGAGLMGLMSRRVEPWEQGQLQGAASSITGITTMLGPQIFTNIFAWSSTFDRKHLVSGSAALTGAGLVLLALLLALRVARPVEPHVRPPK